MPHPEWQELLWGYADEYFNNMAAFIQPHANPPQNLAPNYMGAQELNDRLAFARMGIDWDRQARLPIYRTHHVPFRAGPWTGPDLARDYHNPLGQYGVPPPAIDPQNTALNIWGPSLGRWTSVAGASPAIIQAQAEARAAVVASRMFPHFPGGPAPRFTFVKLLGWGGQGIAALFREDTPNPNNPNRRIRSYYVAKASLAGGRAVIRDERSAMRFFDGYTHVIQISNRPLPAGINTGQLGHGGMQINLMPFAKRGPLEKILVSTQEAARDARIAQGNPPANLNHMDYDPPEFSERLLWHFFDCLLQGVIAMRYPAMGWRIPPHVSPNPDPNHAGFDEIVPTPWQLYHSHYLDHQGWVHFDIDPSNILLDAPHREGLYRDRARFNITPTLVLSDLGSAELVAQLDRPIPPGTQYPWPMPWAHRPVGKQYWRSPEQFTSEWDFMPIHPLPNNREVAGDYKDWTNLYGIACIMWALITRRQPHQSPEPRHYNKAGYVAAALPGAGPHPAPPPISANLNTQLTNHWNAIPNQSWTHGGYLLDRGGPAPGQAMDPLNRLRYTTISARLRHLVVRCMSHHPRHRPPLAEVRREISRWIHVGRRYWRGLNPPQDDAAVRAEVRSCVELGRAGRTASISKLRRWMNNQINYQALRHGL